MKTCVCLVTAFALLLASTASPAQFEVPLTVHESAGVARKAEPISGGVPLPKGMFRSQQSFALFRADGTELPCQVSSLVNDTDGTVRWLLLDFQDDVAAGATNRYVLRAVAPRPRLKTKIKVDRGPDAISVDTGAVRFVIARNRPFGLFDSVTVGGKPVVTGGAATYTQMQGRTGWNDPAPWRPKRFAAGPPDSIELSRIGYLRVTIEVRGKFANDPLGAGYRAWITAWAGKSRVHVRYKLCNSNSQQYTAILVKRSTLTLQLASAAGNVVLGAREPMSVKGGGWLHQGLYLHRTYQDIPGAVKAGTGDETLWTGNGPKDRPAGWLAVQGGSPLLVCDQLFSTNPARRLAASEKSLVLEGIAERFIGPKDAKFKRGRRVGQPWQADGFWLYDCSRHSSEYLFDFAPPADPAALDALARASRNRLWVLAPGEYYSRCDVLGTGRFGTLDDELASYKTWGWTHKPSQVPRSTKPQPGAFVAREDNHYESEADSVQGLLLMYLRTGQRGFFDLAEAWARYHTDLQTWRTDGWRWKDGGIWFPSGGPQGNRRVRQKWNFDWGPDWGKRKGNADCADLWAHSRSKSCYCHFYGSGLADYFCLTGDRDALAAAIDNVEQKDDEFRHFKKFAPGTSAVGSIRGFGRGFEVMMRVLQADPRNDYIRKLCQLSARTLWQSPLLDERGFHASRIGGGFGGMAVKHLSPAIRKWMAQNGITFTAAGGTVDSLSKGDRTWKVRCMGGTWQHIYIHNGADLYARVLDDEDLRDFTIAFAHFTARYMLSPKCHQTWYYTFFDVPDLGKVFDPWAFDHTGTTDGVGCVHSGWYTRFYPDACAKGYSLTGERRLLERARDFWYYGSKRGYRTKQPTGGPNEVARFAGHVPPKDDSVLETARLFYETSHPRKDAQPPAPVKDLQVKLLGDGKAEVRFTAPADAGGGKVLRYQVKAASLPILPYEEWDYARDLGQKRNWWRAANCQGEPAPSKPGAAERFLVTGVPTADRLYFAIRTFDDSHNRSPISNLAAAD